MCSHLFLSALQMYELLVLFINITEGCLIEVIEKQFRQLNLLAKNPTNCSLITNEHNILKCISKILDLLSECEFRKLSIN